MDLFCTDILRKASRYGRGSSEQSAGYLNYNNMAIERERKFLVNRSVWETIDRGQSTLVRQAYLLTDAEKTLRVRVMDNIGWLCIKGRREGISRQEFEYSIPVEDAEQMIILFAKSELTKLRYRVKAGDFTWEVDEFLGDNSGLIVAEIELDSEDQPFDKPAWLGNEVTFDDRYSNSSLASKPFKDW